MQIISMKDKVVNGVAAKDINHIVQPVAITIVYSSESCIFWLDF
jgi:hypothetical protein